MSQNSRGWVDPVMRTGYGARAAVYAIVGILALSAAIHGGEAQGTTDALADLRSEPWGIPVIVVTAAGLLAYMIWRLIDAALDLDDYGTDAKGILARGGLIVTGLIHGALGVSVAGLAFGGSDGGGDGTEKAVATLLSMDRSALLVGLAGLATIGAGFYYGWKGISEGYKRRIRVTRIARKLDPVLKFGCVAMGVVIVIIGVSILYAATQADANAASGLGEALDNIRSAPFGRVLLVLVSFGLIAFAAENLVEAIYRVVLRDAGPDVMTLARWAKRQAAI